MDGMQTDALRDLQNVRWQALRKDIIDGRYKTQPAKKVEIPQLERAILMLSISPVIDGVIQESLLQWIDNFWDNEFSENSYRFRPKRIS